MIFIQTTYNQYSLHQPINALICFYVLFLDETQGPGSENLKKYVVGNAAAETLKSPLTTVFLPIIYIIVFLVGLPANSMALWVFLFRTKKKKPSSIYMANLALADLLFVIWMPLKIAYHLNGNNWTYGEPLCKVLVSFFYGNMYCSILFITCLSVQRYWVVAHPLSQQTKNTNVAVGVCVSIWAFIWLTTTPLYLYDHTVKLTDLNITTCHDVNIIKNSTDPFPSVRLPYYYFTFMAVVVFLIPCVVIVVAYILLLRALENSMQEITAAKNRYRSRVLIVTVLVTFMLPGPVHLLLCVRGLQEPREEHFAVPQQQDCGEDESFIQLHEILQEEQNHRFQTQGTHRAAHVSQIKQRYRALCLCLHCSVQITRNHTGSVALGHIKDKTVICNQLNLRHLLCM
ncbi:proteinase-activated receptor 2-like isoform X2 [Platichthys flesus]|uniref:proteinase-activated receptor 2-like isoform X2 n=1 Tax=Platichthys flesus TaxID=8260 RepID=UPI002DBB9FE3|nr:proteinase-activated receptor 2-like isoform X2 [Platichthys flesus]